MLALLCSVVHICVNSFIKMNKSFSESVGSFNERNKWIDSEKDLFILINKFEQESQMYVWAV